MTIATCIKRLPVCRLRFGGGKNVLVKRDGEKFIVKEAKTVGHISVQLTGREFSIWHGGYEAESPTLCGALASLSHKPPEEAIGLVVLLWGCRHLIDHSEAVVGKILVSAPSAVCSIA